MVQVSGSRKGTPKGSNRQSWPQEVEEVTTDGMENASREYGYDKVRQMIEGQKEKYGWEFIFLGANIDAVETAAPMSADWKKRIDEDYAKRTET